MASKSYPRPGYNSGTLTSAEYERLAHPSIADGLWGHPNDVAPVYADGTGTRTVKIRAGLIGYLRGSVWESGATDILLPTLVANTSGQPRIDLIVLRLDRSDYSVTERVITGTPSAAPVAPALTLNTGSTGFYEFPLAEVRVEHAAAALPASAVTTRAWYLGSDGQIRCKSTTRPTHEVGRRVFEVDTGRELVSNGTSWLVNADDSGWVNVAAATNWRVNLVRVRRLGSVVYLNLDMDRSGPSLGANVTSTLCQVPSGFRPTGTGFFVPAAIHVGKSGRLGIATTGVIALSAHDGVAQGQFVTTSTSWPIG